MRRVAFLAALLAPLPALAHPGGEHVHGLVAGFAHPFSGADHLAAMIAVGLWAGLLGGTARLLLPAAFLVGMLLGGGVGMFEAGLPMIETGILTSIVVLGALTCLAARVPLPAGMAMVAVFGALHGHAHGAEMASDAAAYAVGMLAATALLHGLGVVLASASGEGYRVALRMAGGLASMAALVVAFV